MGKKLIRLVAAVGMGVLLSLTAYGTALAQAQEMQVSGTVTSVTGEKLAGVTVQVRGTDVRTTTDANGSSPSVASQRSSRVVCESRSAWGSACVTRRRPLSKYAMPASAWSNL